MTTVFGILILIILLWGIPTITGAAFVTVDKKTQKPLFMWIMGQLVLWAGFQLLAVPVILLEQDFEIIVWLFSAYILAVSGVSACLYLKRQKEGRFHVAYGSRIKDNKWYVASWVLFWGLLLFQLLQAVFLAYADGDDAFYVAMSGVAENSGVMYLEIVYTGWPSELDVRHGMAPFPIWIAYLARISGIRAVAVNHVVMPLILIPMTYGIYCLLANKLFPGKKERVPLFLIFTELLVLFGDYSFYSVENFMIARSRQGKAALGSIIIPVLFLLLLLLLEKIQENQKITAGFWILLVSATMSGCLCSTMGALLVCMLIGIVGLCAAVCYKRWSFLFPMAACCVPCVVYAGLYLILG